MPADRNAQLIARLERGVASSAELESALGISQTAASRLLRGLAREGRIVRFGATRGARYGSLRPISGIGSQWQLRRIDETGNVKLVGRLSALAAGEYYPADLIGLPAHSTDGTVLGTCVGVDNYGAGDVLDIERPDGKRFMVPMRAEAVPEWDASRLVIDALYAE